MIDYVRSDLRCRGPQPFGSPWQIRGEIVRAVKNRATIRFESNGKAYYLKRHGRIGIGEFLKNVLVGRWPVTGAGNEYRACRYLRDQGMVVPRVAQFGAEGGILSRRSFIVCDALDGYQSLELLLDAGGADMLGPRLRRVLARELGRLVGELHCLGVNHRDLYICHCFYRIEGLREATFDLGLIDLHRAQIRAKTPDRWRLRDLGALFFSCREYGVSALERTAFVRSYERSIGAVDSDDFWVSVERRAALLENREDRRARRPRR